MNCAEFERRLDALLESAPGSEMKVLEEHAAECEACGELLLLARLPAAEPNELVASVLRRTSGSARA